MTFNEKYKDNVILIKSFHFAIEIVEYTEGLESVIKIFNKIINSSIKSIYKQNNVKLQN